MEKTPCSNGGLLDDRAVFVTPDSMMNGCDDNDDFGGGGGGDGDAVQEPTESDVLCGRGGSINSHPGNERFRTLVERRKRVYLTARFKREKRLIASSIVNEIRNLNPPGRFLSRDAKTGKWKDIGDEKARDKTSQALRENAPSIRAEIETEIKEQRAEMQRAEEEASVNAPHHTAPPPGAPPPPGYYPPWGYGYAYPGYPPPPPPPHGGYYAEGPWGAYPPPPQPAYSSPYPQSHSHSPSAKSALEQTADLVVSGAESVKSFFGGGISISGGSVTKASSNDNDHHRSGSRQQQDQRSRGGGGGASSASSVQSKPLMYMHGTKRRRVVKFRDDTSYNERLHQRPASVPASGRRLSASSSSPYYAAQQSAMMTAGDNSFADNSLALSLVDDPEDEDEEDIEPENIDTLGEQNSSLMKQVANHILTSIGSWDGTLCGHDANDERMPFPRSTHAAAGHEEQEEYFEDLAEEDMAVEWEGQEVLLMDKHEDCNSSSTRDEPSPDQMPPPVPRRPFGADAASSVGFSSVGSCHSWLLPDAASFFGIGGGRNGRNGVGLSPSGSIDMEYSAGGGMRGDGMENFSMGGSIGGNSLTRVFEQEADPESHPGPPPANLGSPTTMNQRVIQQMPSWERSLRSRSPLSLGSDDESLMSRTSSKISESGMTSPTHNPEPHDDMVWETRE